MSDIDELERRINAAFDRIETGLEGLGAPSDGAGETGEAEALAQALEDERTANAQLEERVRRIKERQDGHIAELERQVAEQREAMAALDRDLQGLRAATRQLRDSNAALREANAEGVGEAELINAAMKAELEALRASRAAEVAEADAILAAMAGLVNGAGERTGAARTESSAAQTTATEGES